MKEHDDDDDDDEVINYVIADWFAIKWRTIMWL